MITNSVPSILIKKIDNIKMLSITPNPTGNYLVYNTGYLDKLNKNRITAVQNLIDMYTNLVLIGYVVNQKWIQIDPEIKLDEPLSNELLEIFDGSLIFGDDEEMGILDATQLNNLLCRHLSYYDKWCAMFEALSSIQVVKYNFQSFLFVSADTEAG